ncbi:uncharacterized protein LOC132718733 [Ruditapes philippinarum]|uniref:uncharacterized protein LOC132718733 n=1 Tax=Ruditapes philippinarum TaxID=129788 RepID=UPI00295B231B|nr:uncharacterized protein LOC132718733 [Ruditapes philippinarum]
MILFYSFFETHFCLKTFLDIAFVGFCFLGVNRVEAADECYFDKKESVYCQYGCCGDTCCPMTTAALIGLVVSTVVGLACLLGCMFCLYCIFKNQGKAKSNASMVYPSDFNSKIYRKDSTQDDNKSYLSSISSESLNQEYQKKNPDLSFQHPQQSYSNMSYTYSQPRPANY